METCYNGLQRARYFKVLNVPLHYVPSDVNSFCTILTKRCLCNIFIILRINPLHPSCTQLALKPLIIVVVVNLAVVVYLTLTISILDLSYNSASIDLFKLNLAPNYHCCSCDWILCFFWKGDRQPTSCSLFQDNARKFQQGLFQLICDKWEDKAISAQHDTLFT